MYGGDGFFSDSKTTLGLDPYGYPGVAVANHALLKSDDYGESLEDLTDEWEVWLHHMPFDARVAEALVRLYEKRLGPLDPQKDAAALQRLERKLQLARGRAERYNPRAFQP